MASCDYPELEEHRKGHAALIQKVQEYQHKFTEGKISVANEVFNFLKSWLIQHIQGTDKKYSPYLRDKGVR